MLHEKLQEKLSELYQKEQDTSIKMRAESDLRIKRKIELEKGAINVEIKRLQAQLDAKRDKQALEELNQMLQDNILLIFVSVNNVKVQPHKEVEIKYTCGHKKKMLLRELLRKNTLREGKFHPERNCQLLQRWNRVLQHGESYPATFSCKQCRDEKNSLKSKFGRRNDKPIGHARVTIRALQ